MDNATLRLGTAQIDGEATALVGWGGGCAALADLLVTAPATTVDLIAEWQDVRAGLAAAVESYRGPLLDEASLAWLPPVAPHKVICIGSNYRAHGEEMRGAAPTPTRPYSFMKPPSTSLVGSGRTVRLPGHATKIDYEAELAVVMGTGGQVFGYSILNDLSARDWIPAENALGLDWVMLKCWDRSAPLGPWITPVEAIADCQALDIRLTVNGELRQESSTADMVFSVAEIVAHLSAIMTLEPGDVIGTGTPAGVGFARTPPLFLEAGDAIRIEIERLGVLETVMGAH